MYSIGIITAEQSLHNIMKIDKEMRKYCNITYLPYSSLEHLKFIYSQNKDRFDSFLFSGFFPYKVILEQYTTIAKPHAFFSISDRDYYRIIARIAIKHPGINFSRVYFDKPDISIDFTSVFDNNNFPMLDSSIEQQHTNSISDDYLPRLDYYCKLWNTGLVDLIVTRYSSMKNELSNSNINYEILLASPESMLEIFHGLIMRLNLESVNDSSTCIGLVTSANDTLTNLQRKELLNRLNNCNKQFGRIFLIYEHGDRYELTTNISTLKSLTQQYTICPISSYLQDGLDFNICVGWGCSTNVVDAHRNAQRSIKLSKQNSASATYIINQDNIVIGPLSSTRCITYTDSPNENLTTLGKKISMSPLYISKIRSILTQKGVNSISSEELAYFLSITTRSASRILTKLEKGGIATVQYNRQLNLRGRPAKVYTIDFSNFDTIK